MQKGQVRRRCAGSAQEVHGRCAGGGGDKCRKVKCMGGAGEVHGRCAGGAREVRRRWWG